MVGCVVAVVMVVTAIVFGANLTRLVTHKAEYGWPWSAAVITGAGYGDLDRDRVAADLNGRHDVAAWAPLAMDSSALVAGKPVPTVLVGPGYAGIAPPIVEGRLPLTANEVALGRTTASDLHISIGDVVDLSSPLLAKHRRSKVVGTMIASPFGQFEADRGGLGVGAIVPAGDDFPTENYSAVVIDLDKGHQGSPLLRELRPRLTAWDVNGVPPVTLSKPVRPPEVVDADELRQLPLLLGAAIGLSTMVGLSLLVLLSVRDRRGELAVLRVLGFTGRQVRRSVRWQTLTSVRAGPGGRVAGGMDRRSMDVDPVRAAIGRTVERDVPGRLDRPHGGGHGGARAPGCHGPGSSGQPLAGRGRRRGRAPGWLMPRLFVAVWPPDEILDEIAALPRADEPGVRWTAS